MVLVGANLAGESGENVHDHRRPRLMPTNLGVLEAIALLLKGDEGSAQIVSFHGALHRVVDSNDGATPSSPAP
jgi:hypothetical protein